MKRREFHQRVITVGAASAVAAAQSAVFVPAPTTDPFKDPAFIRNLAGRLAVSQRENGGVGVLPVASRAFSKIRQLVTSKDAQLQRASAYLARQIAWTLHDVRRFDAAENVGRVALELAQRGQDVEGQAWAFSLLSANDAERRRDGRSVQYAQAGLRLGGVGSGVHAELASRLGRSLALVRGQERDARRAIEQALDLEGFSPFDAADISDDAGDGFFDLGMYDAAFDSFGRAAQLREQWPALQANCLGKQVRAALCAHGQDPQREWLELAADRMFALAHTVPLVSSARVDEHVTDILAATTRWNNVPRIRDAREALKAYGSRGPAGTRPADEH